MKFYGNEIEFQDNAFPWPYKKSFSLVSDQGPYCWVFDEYIPIIV